MQYGFPKTRADIATALSVIKPGQWVLYAASRSIPVLDKDAENARLLLMKQAKKLEETGRAMLLQKKQHGTYYMFARGVDPQVKKLVEAYALAMPRWPAVSLPVQNKSPRLPG